MRVFALVMSLLVPSLAAAQAAIPASGGNIVITPIRHASFQIAYNNRLIQVDPVSSNTNNPPTTADLILVTDIHGDHMDAAAIQRFRKPEGQVIAPAAVRDALAGKAGDITVLGNGQSQTIAGMNIEAVPMYNLQRGPSAGQLFHTKGRGNGYIVTLGGKRIYIAGDTECTPEMKALKNIDVAFVPMNLPYTMTPAEAAECVKAFAPKVVYPYHSGSPKDVGPSANAQEFAAAMKGTAGIEVRVEDWYPK